MKMVNLHASEVRGEVELTMHGGDSFNRKVMKVPPLSDEVKKLHDNLVELSELYKSQTESCETQLHMGSPLPKPVQRNPRKSSKGKGRGKSRVDGDKNRSSNSDTSDSFFNSSHNQTVVDRKKLFAEKNNISSDSDEVDSSAEGLVLTCDRFDVTTVPGEGWEHLPAEQQPQQELEDSSQSYETAAESIASPIQSPHTRPQASVQGLLSLKSQTPVPNFLVMSSLSASMHPSFRNSQDDQALVRFSLDDFAAESSQILCLDTEAVIGETALDETLNVNSLNNSSQSEGNSQGSQSSQHAYFSMSMSEWNAQAAPCSQNTATGECVTMVTSLSLAFISSIIESIYLKIKKLGFQNR